MQPIFIKFNKNLEISILELKEMKELYVDISIFENLHSDDYKYAIGSVVLCSRTLMF